MNKAPDRAKMRREYLEDRAGLRLAAWLCSIVTIVSGFLLLYLPLKSYLPDNPFLAFLVCVVLGGAAIKCVFERRVYIEKLKSLPYVPPVHEQLVALPAEEVLLRGSEAPAASPEELLRPAGRHETPAEELLRGTDG